MHPIQPDVRHPRTDLRTEADVKTVVDVFYHRMAEDPVIGHFFAGINMPAHLPKMYAFWSSVVFQTGTYHGRPLDAHVALKGLSETHFERWLARFEATVDALFAGEAAERMKAKARQIATIFQIRLGLNPAGSH